MAYKRKKRTDKKIGGIVMEVKEEHWTIDEVEEYFGDVERPIFG